MKDIKNIMPIWGPYSKKYMGISRVIDKQKDLGARFDFTVHPTVWNSATPVPNVTIPSNYHLMECSADYSYFRYRYELEWKDQVYADISFSKYDDETFIVKTEFVNNTNLVQNCILNFFSSIEYPFDSYIKINKNDSCVIKNANDYDSYEYVNKRPWDGENPDGMFKGMFRDKDFYLSCGLGDRCDHAHVHFLNLKPFGCEKGDFVSYTFSDVDNSDDYEIVVRYKTVTESDASFNVNNTEIIFKQSEHLTFTRIPYSKSLEMTSLGTGGIEFDFFAVCKKGEDISVEAIPYAYKPEIAIEDKGNGHKINLVYTYPDNSTDEFTLRTYDVHTRERILDSGCLEDALINRLSNGDHTYDELRETFSNSFKRKKSDEGFFQNTLIKSIFIKENDSLVEYAVISKHNDIDLSIEECEKVSITREKDSISVKFNECGRKYDLSTSIMRATLLTNTVYPVYKHGENVIHHTPGKRWDSFYTWDSGFIGMGLLEYSNDLCRYVLETYLCDEDNKDFAFLLHGSLVPTQFTEYFELLKRTNNKHELDSIYPKMKRYYEYLQGRIDASNTNKFNNGLLTVYDYWYSCSGMDDYPAQVEMIKNKAEDYSCSCLTTCHIIRAAKILKMVAAYLGYNEDIKVYDNDIARSENALNELAWDEESGYYGYTMYDKDEPYIMKTEDGENWDKGFDGVYPLFSSSAPKDRREKLLSHIKNPNEMWSNAGISAVDMSASYYFDDGYWNGNVWMSHQYYMWKTMLDLGDSDFAFEIAKRALDMWKAETDSTYNTYECFGIQTKRGGWFHNFGGLSAPICIWADAYYRPQTVTTGYDVWTDYQNTEDDNAEISFKYYGDNDKYTMIVTLSGEYKYEAYLNDEKIEYNLREDGCLEFTFDSNVKSGILKVTRG